MSNERSSSERYSEIKDRQATHSRFDESQSRERVARLRGPAIRERSRPDGFPTVHRAGVTPVPIPNTEVKPHFGDGTAHFLGGRVARRWDLLGGARSPSERRYSGRRFLFQARSRTGTKGSPTRSARLGLRVTVFRLRSEDREAQPGSWHFRRGRCSVGASSSLAGARRSRFDPLRSCEYARRASSIEDG